MKVTIKNKNGQLFAVTPDGLEFRMIHSYIREPVYENRNKWGAYPTENIEVVGSRRIGVVCAIEVNGEIQYGFSMVKPPDVFNPKIGLAICAGKALTRPMTDPNEFYNAAGWSHKDPTDDLLSIYNRAQRYLRPLLHE